MTTRRAIAAALDRAIGPLPLPPCAQCGWPEKHTVETVLIEAGLDLPPCTGCGTPLAPDGSPVGAPDEDGNHRLHLIVFPRGFDMGEHLNDDIIRHPA